MKEQKRLTEVGSLNVSQYHQASTRWRQSCSRYSLSTIFHLLALKKVPKIAPVSEREARAARVCWFWCQQGCSHYTFIELPNHPKTRKVVSLRARIG